MNAGERVMAALTGQVPDRPPKTALFSLYGAKLAEVPLDEYYRDPRAYVRGQIAACETFQPDIVFSPFAFALFGGAFRGELKRHANMAPVLLRPGVGRCADIDHIQFPDVDSNQHLIYFREAVRHLRSTLGPEVPIAAPSLTPLDLPAMVYGLETWTDAFLFDVDAVRRTLDRIVPFFVAWSNALLADGAACIVMPAAFVSPAILPPQVVAERCLPILSDAFRQVKGALVMHHGGSTMLPLLPFWKNLPANVVAFAIAENDDPTQARALLGAERVIMTGPDAVGFPRRSPGEIQEQARRLAAIARENPRFIMTTTGPDLPWTTPRETVAAWFDA